MALGTPYDGIAEPLVDSIVRCFEELIDPNLPEVLVDVASIPDANINRHFLWLTQYGDKFKHFVSGNPSESIQPLGNSITGSAKQLSEELSSTAHKAFLKKMSLPKKYNGTVTPDRPTRISKLLKSSIEQVLKDSGTSRRLKKDGVRRAIVLPSPYSIAEDFLTIPAQPASKSYAFVALRNLLFERFRLIPADLIPEEQRDEKAKFIFSIQDLEKAVMQSVTYTSPRWRSKGRDPLPSNEHSVSHDGRLGGLLRSLLGLTGVFWLRFNDFEELKTYATTYKSRRSIGKRNGKKANAVKYSFEYYRPEALLELPPVGELTNLLWGAPLPIRGADIIFRGGVKFPSRGGLVLAIHGAPGTGKTSLSLAIGASLSPFGVDVDFFTAEETPTDLEQRAKELLPSELRGEGYNAKNKDDWLHVHMFELFPDSDISTLDTLTSDFRDLGDALRTAYQNTDDPGVPFPCSNVVVIDGLHDLAQTALNSNRTETDVRNSIHKFIERCRSLNALVIVTTGTDLTADRSLDYLVDIAVTLEHNSLKDGQMKPERRFILSKARHQLCSTGSHGFFLSGENGVRFTPQSNYLLDKQSIRAPRLPDQSAFKKVLKVHFHESHLEDFPATKEGKIKGRPEKQYSDDNTRSVKLFRGSNIFINGEGSGGKAGLALKVAASPIFDSKNDNEVVMANEKVMVISFLYPKSYYDDLKVRIDRLFTLEYPNIKSSFSLEALYLYPGYLRPETLFNRIEWSLEQARLMGEPFTSVVIDGIHNVFLQFPEIEQHKLFWPQLFNMLKSRELTLVVTHTQLSIRKNFDEGYFSIDDERSDALRHALIHKMDFSLEVDPVDDSESGEHNAFYVSTNSAIGQLLPPRDVEYFWSRERLVFYSTGDYQPTLPL